MISGAGLGHLVDRLADSLGVWLLSQDAGWTLVWAVVGAICSGFGGAIAGFFADLQHLRNQYRKNFLFFVNQLA